MKSNIINRLLSGLERQATQSAKQRLRDSFEGYHYLHSSRKDTAEIRKMIQEHNSIVREYNKTGEELAYLFIHKMDQFQAQPQDDLLGAIDEWLRLRSLKNNPGVFRSINTGMHQLERKMTKLSTGDDGIEKLRNSIKKKRTTIKSR